jgi:5-methylcytosine-specific restriction endonuclease McrA
MNKNTKSQLEYIKDYFKSTPKKNLETTKIKGIVENNYLRETGKRFEDCDRGIRSLYQKGWLIKVKKGCYKYDPDFSSKDKTTHDFTDKVKKQILKRDNYSCVVCKLGKKEKAELHIDHVTPRDRGGPSTLENGQTLCSRCNFLKKNMSMNSLGKKIFDDLLKKSMKNKNKEMIKIAKEFLALFKKYNLN